MKQTDFIGIVPSQHTGKEIEAKASLELNDEEKAKSFYDVVKERLLNVNAWHEKAGLISANFQIMDTNGEEVNRKVEKGDYFKIDIPGPGRSEGDGYDWVCVEELKEVSDGDMQSVGFRVRPSENPFGEKKETSHFYSNDATSNFIVTREGKKISVWIIDRNIKPNAEAASMTDKLRDTTIGMGAMGIFSKIQWQRLADALVKCE
jgi:hypothetical protein